MIGTSLTTRAVYVFGALLVLIGLVFIAFGVPIVRLELGWTEIIGGAVAASAGCIILVLGLFLARLEAFQETLDKLVPAAVPAAPSLVAPELERAPEPEPVPVVAEPEPAPIEAAARYPVIHPLAPGGRRERFGRISAKVMPEPALAAAAAGPESDEPPPVDPPEAPALTESAPALVHADEEASSHSPAVEPFEPAKARPGFMSSILARRLTAAAPRIRLPTARPAIDPALPSTESVRRSPLRRSVVDLASGWDEETPEPVVPAPAQEPTTHEATAHEPVGHEPAPALEDEAGHEHAAHEAESAAPPPAEVEAAAPEIASLFGDDPVAEVPKRAPKPEVDPLQPVVVGRYNAGAASYVMYSNGMIEVETEQGTHQFASMQELKSFIERRDTASAHS